MDFSDTSPNNINESIKGCFFIYDDYDSGEEESNAEELLLYFFPNQLTLNKKLFLLGGCSAMISFGKHFPSNNPNGILLMKLSTVKLAVMEIEKVTFVLTSDSTSSDESLKQHLNIIIESLLFFNGPLNSIKKRFPDRKTYVEEISRASIELLPLITQFQASNPMRPFAQLPYTELPNKMNRLFITASQLLSCIKLLDNNNYGGCILYDHSLLCSHLDIITNRCILNRIEYIKGINNNNNNNNNNSNNNGNNKYNNPLFTSPIKLDIDNNNNSNNNNLDSELITIFLYNTQIKQFSNHLDDEINNNNNNSEQGGDFYGMYIVTINKLSLAVVMKLSALQEKKHIKKIQLYTDNKLIQLEKLITKTLNENIPSYRLLNNVRIPYSGVDNNGNNSNNSNAYHFLLHDGVSESTIGSTLAPVDFRFSYHLSNSRNIFQQNNSNKNTNSNNNSDDVTQVILRDHKSDIYSRKVFDREIYFQPTGSNPHDLFMDHIEKTIQKSLKNDHTVNLL